MTVSITEKFMFKVVILLIVLSPFCSIAQENINLISPKKLVYNFNMVHDNPGETPFVTKYNDAAFLVSKGFNGHVPRVYVPCAVHYDNLDKQITPEGSAIRKKIDDYASKLDSIFASDKKAGIPVYPFTDVLIVPKTVAEKYSKEMTSEGNKGAIGVLGGTRLNASILKQRTQDILRIQIANVFDRFPIIDGLIIRFGETYLHEFPDFAGGSPAKTPEELSVMINILREEICVKRNKKLFFRTWDFTGFHTNPEFYLKVTNAVEPHPNLIFSIKHVQADYLRLYPFNPCLGIGKHRQLVEISCNPAGVYGKNAHPYYIGKGVIDGWDEFSWINVKPRCLRDLLSSALVCGIWTWSRGDGWAGPYIGNELWVDLNIEVFNRFFKNPERPETELFNEAAHDIFGISGKELDKLRQLCLLTASAVVKGQATVYAHVSDWWCRDEYITAVDLSEIVKIGKVKEVLAEKAEAVGMWKKIESLSREIKMPDKANQEFLQVSCTYGRIKYQLFEQVWMMQLLSAESEINNAPIDKVSLEKAINAYDKLWNEWQKLKNDHASCPTLYVDDKAQHCPFPPFREVLNQYRKKI